MRTATLLLGRELRAARRNRKLTQQSLAQRAGLDLATVAGLERGQGTVGPLLAALTVLEHRFAGQGNDVDLGRWLRERRRSARLSQERLCERTGLTRPSITQVER